MATTNSSEDNGKRDQSAVHQRMINERQVSPEVMAAWEELNERCELAGQMPYGPPWAYQPYGRLRETPPLRGMIGFIAEPVSDDDLKELRELVLLWQK